MQSFPQSPPDAALGNPALAFAAVAERCRVLEQTLDAWRERLLRADHELRQPVTTLGLLNHALQRAPDLETSRSLSLRLTASIELLRSLLDSLAQQNRRLYESCNQGPADEIADPGLPAPRTESAPLHGFCVWVIEDHPQVRESLRLLLETWGAEAVLFDGRSPLDKGSPTPDVVLIDQHLSCNTTGLGLAAQLQTLFPQARLALLTGDTEAALLREAQHAGIPILRKPVRPGQLLRALLGHNRSPPSP